MLDAASYDVAITGGDGEFSSVDELEVVTADRVPGLLVFVAMRRDAPCRSRTASG